MKIPNRSLLILLSALFAPALLAQTVFKSVEDGVPTFSDSPPPDGDAEVLTIDVPPVADDGLLDERLTAMRETTDRMAADRREREQHRAELKKLQQEAALAARSPPPASAAGYDSWSQSTVLAPGIWPGYRYPIRPRPRHPVARPHPRPLAATRPGVQPPPGWSVMRPGNAQLMRPVVSSRD